MTPPRFDSPTRTNSVSTVTVCSNIDGEFIGEGTLLFGPDWVGTLAEPVWLGPWLSTWAEAGSRPEEEELVVAASSGGGGSGNHPICLRNKSNPKIIPNDR